MPEHSPDFSLPVPLIVSWTDKGGASIPLSLRKYAKITKEVTIIGVSNRLEIWDSQLWSSYNDNDDLNYEDIANNMAMLGI